MVQPLHLRNSLSSCCSDKHFCLLSSPLLQNSITLWYFLYGKHIRVQIPKVSSLQLLTLSRTDKSAPSTLPFFLLMYLSSTYNPKEGLYCTTGDRLPSLMYPYNFHPFSCHVEKQLKHLRILRQRGRWPQANGITLKMLLDLLDNCFFWSWISSAFQ